jgi:hypothetical protein
LEHLGLMADLVRIQPWISGTLNEGLTSLDPCNPHELPREWYQGCFEIWISDH